MILLTPRESPQSPSLVMSVGHELLRYWYIVISHHITPHTAHAHVSMFLHTQGQGGMGIARGRCRCHPRHPTAITRGKGSAFCGRAVHRRGGLAAREGEDGGGAEAGAGPQEVRYMIEKHKRVFPSKQGNYFIKHTEYRPAHEKLLSALVSYMGRTLLYEDYYCRT